MKPLVAPLPYLLLVIGLALIPAPHVCAERPAVDPIVARWRSAALEAIRDTSPGPPTCACAQGSEVGAQGWLRALNYFDANARPARQAGRFQ